MKVLGMLWGLLTGLQEVDEMEILQLCELKDVYGYAGFCFSDNQYYQFRITEDRKFVKRFNCKKSAGGHEHLFQLLRVGGGSEEQRGPFVTIPELTLEQLELAATRMLPGLLDCSWAQSRFPDIKRHETLLAQ
jgi:hypothetical protein